jgi:ABC-type glycerol-3-phosphate transport system substrate-binding protein
MSYLTRFIPAAALMLVALAMLAACTDGAATESAPTPPGLLEGKPTFVYLWNSP